MRTNPCGVTLPSDGPAGRPTTTFYLLIARHINPLCSDGVFDSHWEAVWREFRGGCLVLKLDVSGRRKAVGQQGD